MTAVGFVAMSIFAQAAHAIPPLACVIKPRWRCVFTLMDSLGPLVSALASERVDEPASTAPLNFPTLRFRRPDRGATETTPVRSQ